MLLLLIAMDLVATSLAKPDDVTGHAAHFGGYLAGLIFGVHFVRNVKVTSCERVLKERAQREMCHKEREREKI